MAEAAPPAEAPAAAPAAEAPALSAAEAAAAEIAAPPAMPPAGGMSAPTSPTKKEKGPVKQALDLKYERLSGVVKSYDASQGYGYVTSHLFPDTVTFRIDKVMPEFEQHVFYEGEPVEFDVQTDERGSAHAVMMKPFVGLKPHDCIGQRHRGYVRRCAERWGFLNAAAFDGDLFVHRDNLLMVPGQYIEGQPPLRQGQPVAFDVAEDDRRRAVARQITTHALPRPGDMVGNRLHGTVRSFQGAWGFIISENFAGDLFVHRDSFNQKDPEINVGMIVAFDVERDQRRKGSRDRLVARRVDIIGGQDPSAAQAMMPQAYGQQPMMDPSAYMAGAMNPQAAYAPTMPQMYYPPLDPAGMPYAQPNPYAFAQPNPYLQQPLMQPAQMQQPLLPQQPYQLPAQVPGVPQVQVRPQMPVQPNPYLPAGVAPAMDTGALVQAMAMPAAQPKAAEPQPPIAVAGAAPGAAPGAEGAQGLLHITMHDWEPDQPGQLWVAKGTLVNVSYRAAHGWVYAGTANPGAETTEPASEGWLPQAVVKRVSLCRVAMAWPSEGSGTLGVNKGEVIAVSKEAERGWVYGERIGPRQPDLPADGWLPKKVLDYLQS